MVWKYTLTCREALCGPEVISVASPRVPRHHVVVGYESAAVSGAAVDRQFYIVDGDVAGEKTSTAVQGRGYDASKYATFGTAWNLTGNPFNGMIADYAAYNLSNLNDAQFQAKMGLLAGHYSDSTVVPDITVPEPSAIILLASGLLGLLCYAWRKRK